MAWSELVGYLAAALTTCSFIPQAWLTFRTRDVRGVSLGMYSAFTVGVGLWLAYGVLLAAWPIIVANAITLTLAGSILGMKLRYRERAASGRGKTPPWRLLRAASAMATMVAREQATHNRAHPPGDHPMQRRLMLSAVAAAALLAACGGGDDEGFRGTLLEDPANVATLTAAQINGGTQASGLQALTGAARCDVRVVSLNYRTPGARGEQTNASGVLLVPAGPCAAERFPLLAYARGTDVQQPRTLANPQDGETFLLAAMYAAQGYAVVATDYLGYAKSNYGYHPYLHADSEATTVVDSIRAARRALAQQGAATSGKVMVTGYSQGGHASMAAHRAIESSHAGEIDLVAGAHLAGPYNLSGSFKLTNAIAGYQFFVPFIVTSWQKVYGTIYGDVNQAFKAPYASYIENLLPSPDLNFTTLVTTGRLPGGPNVTPDQARDALFQSAFLAAAQGDENSGLFQAAKRNDLLGWSPRARTLLCGGAGDPTVPPAVHQAPAKADFDSRGLSNVSSVDVDPMIRATFGVNGQAPTDPASAAFATYYGNYHGSYEPPFCHAQARAVFDAVR
jgi:uncharacterized protein with PQ loop repeat